MALDSTVEGVYNCRMQDTSNSNSKLITLRIATNMLERIDTVRHAIGEDMSLEVRSASVIKMCLKRFMPELERQYGITPPEEVKPDGKPTKPPRRSKRQTAATTEPQGMIA